MSQVRSDRYQKVDTATISLIKSQYGLVSAKEGGSAQPWHYQNTHTLMRKSVEVYHRDSDIWTSRVYKPDNVVYLKSIGLEITFAEIYDKTSLE